LAVFRGLSGVAFLSFRRCRQSSSDFSDFGLPVSTVQIPVPVRSVGSPLISFQMMEEARGGGQLAQGFPAPIPDLKPCPTLSSPVSATSYHRVLTRYVRC
jgi:hypothetical protein